MKNLIIGFILGILVSISFWYGKNYLLTFQISNPLSPLAATTPTPKPLEKYTFYNLKNRTFEGSEITIDRELKEAPLYTSHLFHFFSDGKKVSGLLTIPNKTGLYPVLVQFRGFVPKEIFETGVGTIRSAEVFAQNGFITLAPDFLGYGESASPSAIPIEERFETYTTALNMLASVKNLNVPLEKIYDGRIHADYERVGIWGHSNGGHIALSVLEISGMSYPTVLWAPVSKPFPYSILYYTDDSDDHGKALRRLVSHFEKDYDVENYSLTNYLDWIVAPIQLHQGSADDAIPLQWSANLYNSLKELDNDITYFTYPGDDHNFAQGSWNTVVARNIEFYKKRLSP